MFWGAIEVLSRACVYEHRHIYGKDFFSNKMSATSVFVLFYFADISTSPFFSGPSDQNTCSLLILSKDVIGLDVNQLLENTSS